MFDPNVLLLTLDSCSYSTALRARTPNLDAVGPLELAEAAGNYTLPAHIAIFNGNLPRSPSAPIRLWRSSLARSSEPASIVFHGRTLMDHYGAAGFRVAGVGGVSFFDVHKPGNLLPSLFPTFRYFGSRREEPLGQRLENRGTQLALARSEEILEMVDHAERFFLFVNCAVTHIPYVTPGSEVTGKVVEAVKRAYIAHDHKWTPHTGGTLTPDDSAVLRDLQVAALEWADSAFGRLLQGLDRGDGLLVVVCADHGEEFGEGGRYGHGHNHPSVLQVPLWSGLLR